MASRNLIVRLGVDAAGFLKKMAQAGYVAESTGKKINKSLTLDERASMADRLKQLQASYDAVRKATEFEDIDLSRPLSRQIDDAEKSYHELLEAAQKTKDTLRSALNADGKKGSPENIAALRNELSLLREAAEESGFELERLRQIAAQISPENMNFASHVGITKLESDIRQLEAALDDTGDEADRSESFLSKMSRSLRSTENSGRRLNLIPGFLRKIGDSAGRNSLRLEKMMRTIRNVSIVSFGLRIARSLFGEFSTIIRNHISQDAALQAQVNGLSAALGQSLAPAVSLVTNALSYVLPYVVGFANAVSSLMGLLFGSGWSAAAAGANKTAVATGGAAKAQKELNRQLMSFDQINKLDSQSDTGSAGGGGGAGTGALAAIEAKVPAWLERFKQSFSDLFNSSEFQAANVGGKIGMILQTGLDWIGTEAVIFDWSAAGRSLRENFDSFLDAGWGESLADTLLALLKGAVSGVLTFLFPELSKVGTVLREQGTDAAIEFVDGIMIGWAVGMVEWIADVGGWIKTNITDPIVNWFKFWFGIHSPSTVFAELGENCMSGLANGFTTGMTWILQKIDDLKTRVINAAQTLKDAFSFEWSLPHLRLPHLSVEWDPVDNVLAQFFGVTAFPRLSVSWFAKGGILDGAQIFGRMGNTLLGGGERGREAILPLDTNTGWMDVLANRIAQSLDVGGGNGGNVTVNVLLDGDLITTYVLKGMRQKTRAGTASV